MISMRKDSKKRQGKLKLKIRSKTINNKTANYPFTLNMENLVLIKNRRTTIKRATTKVKNNSVANISTTTTSITVRST